MPKKKTKTKFPSELRYDLVGQDWVVIATGRGKRPETFKKEKRLKDTLPRAKCPFCHLSSQERPTLIFHKGSRIDLKEGGKIPADWTTIVIPNKYPAVVPHDKLDEHTEGGIHKKMNAVGFHEVIITRHHTKQLAQFSVTSIREVIEVYQTRYLELKDKKFVNYISMFHNHGAEAGASISHPHSQILTTPLIDVGLKKALSNAERFFREKGSCIYCVMNKEEKRVRQRIVFENDNFLVLCPFASKVAFEVIISPKKHLSYFEKATNQEKDDLAEAFHEALGRLYKGLDDPSYNFYLHTAPCDNQQYPSYHWHWTILPKTSIPAGFEFGTGIEISTIEPEKAAEYLRRQ